MVRRLSFHTSARSSRTTSRCRQHRPICGRHTPAERPGILASRRALARGAVQVTSQACSQADRRDILLRRLHQAHDLVLGRASGLDRDLARALCREIHDSVLRVCLAEACSQVAAGSAIARSVEQVFLLVADSGTAKAAREPRQPRVAAGLGTVPAHLEARQTAGAADSRAEAANSHLVARTGTSSVGPGDARPAAPDPRVIINLYKSQPRRYRRKELQKDATRACIWIRYLLKCSLTGLITGLLAEFG